MLPKLNTTQYIKQRALALGFDECGITKATFLKEEHEHYIKWLEEKKQGTISYLEKNIELKTDPRKISSNIKSVIGLFISYYPFASQNPDAFYKISKYAYVRDYHIVLKEKLTALIDEMKTIEPNAEYHYFTDSNRLLEKAWAIQCGLGWRGKNSLLLNKDFGSFVFIGIIITSLELEYDKVQNNHCGNCTKCIDACPVNAIEKPFEINASKCIANLTIAQKNEETLSQKNTHGWIYGCDLCQDVCPWNKKIKPTNNHSFSPNQELLSMKKEDWEKLDEEKFNNLFNESAINHIGFEKMKRNIERVNLLS